MPFAIRRFILAGFHLANDESMVSLRFVSEVVIDPRCSLPGPMQSVQK